MHTLWLDMTGKVRSNNIIVGTLLQGWAQFNCKTFLREGNRCQHSSTKTNYAPFHPYGTFTPFNSLTMFTVKNSCGDSHLHSQCGCFENMVHSECLGAHPSPPNHHVISGPGFIQSVWERHPSPPNHHVISGPGFIQSVWGRYPSPPNHHVISGPGFIQSVWGRYPSPPNHHVISIPFHAYYT